MCEKAVDTCLPALKFVPDWFVTNKMRKRLGSVLFFNYDIDLDDIDSDIVTFFDDCMGLVMIELNNINFDDDIFDEDDPINIVLLDLFLTVKNLNHVIKYRRKINVYSMTTNKSVSLVYGKR